MNGEDDLLEEDGPHKPDGVCILDEVCNWREEEDKKEMMVFVLHHVLDLLPEYRRDWPGFKFFWGILLHNSGCLA